MSEADQNPGERAAQRPPAEPQGGETGSVLDQILGEVRDIRTILEGLMQPLVVIDPANPHVDISRMPQAFSVREVGSEHAKSPLELRPFGIDGIDAPVGTIIGWPRERILPNEWAYCSGGLAPKDMHEMLLSDRLPDTTDADRGSNNVHIIKVSHG